MLMRGGIKKGQGRKSMIMNVVSGDTIEEQCNKIS
jgi:hypothetical protein